MDTAGTPRELLLGDYWHRTMCAIVQEIRKGWALYEPHLSDRKGNESSLTQMNYALDGVGGRRKS